VTQFLDFLGMTSYSQIKHFIALEPTVKKILSIKISIFYTSAVLKLLQQKYKLQEDAIHNEIKDHFSFPKLYSVFLHHFWFWKRRFLKEMLFGTFWHVVCPVCT
jgi:hypothetical protein